MRSTFLALAAAAACVAGVLTAVVAGDSGEVPDLGNPIVLQSPIAAASEPAASSVSPRPGRTQDPTGRGPGDSSATDAPSPREKPLDADGGSAPTKPPTKATAPPPPEPRVTPVPEESPTPTRIPSPVCTVRGGEADDRGDDDGEDDDREDDDREDDDREDDDRSCGEARQGSNADDD
ncbi:MAG: hypothetical protein ACT4P1_14490 [Sporichthyaceae bacterium]